MKTTSLGRLSTLCLLAASTSLLPGCQDTAQAPNPAAPTSASEVQAGAIVDEGEYVRIEGDMLLQKSDPDHAAILREIQGGQAVAGRSALVTAGAIKKWPNGYVPYYFSGAWTATEKAAVRTAMKAYSDVASINFTETTARGSYILKVEKGAPAPGCYAAGSSTLGYVSAPVITLLPEDVTNQGVLIHELGHTLGFDHEHSRPERGQFISINWSNLTSPVTSIMQQVFTSPTNHTPYDVWSVMHYKSYSTAPAGCTVIDPAKPILTTLKGHSILNTKLSSMDIQGLKLTYGSSTPYPSPILTIDGTLLKTWTTASAPSDIGVSNDHVYVRFANRVEQLSKSTLSLVSSRAVVLDAIDYEGTTMGVVGVNNATKKVHLDVFGGNQSISYPAGVTTVYSVGGRVVNGERRILLATPNQNVGSTIREYRLVNNVLSATGATGAIGMYQATDVTTDGSSAILGASVYYFAYFFRSATLGGANTSDIRPAGYNAHGYFDGNRYLYQEVRPFRYDYSPRNGVNGAWSLVRYADRVELVFNKLAF